MFWVLPIGLLRGSILTALRKAVSDSAILGVWVGVVVLPTSPCTGCKHAKQFLKPIN